MRKEDVRAVKARTTERVKSAHVSETGQERGIRSMFLNQRYKLDSRLGFRNTGDAWKVAGLELSLSF